MGEPTESEFPSITRRSEQAAQTQQELHEIAQQGGWQPPKPEDLLKASADSGLPEGTPLASKDSLTPGQLKRIDQLQADQEKHAADPEWRLNRIVNNGLDKDKTASLGGVAREVRSNSEESYDRDAQSHDPAYDPNTRYMAKVDSEKVTGLRPVVTERYLAKKQLLSKKYVPQSVETMTNDYRFPLQDADWAQGWERKHLADKVDSARTTASTLYDLNPERYKNMTAADFVNDIEEYGTLWKEKEANEERAEELEASIRGIEYLRREGGDTVGNALATERETGIAMRPSDTLQGYFDAVLTQLKEKAGRFKGIAGDKDREIATKFGPQVSSAEPLAPPAEAPPTAPPQPDDHMAQDHDTIERGYN